MLFQAKRLLKYIALSSVFILLLSPVFMQIPAIKTQIKLGTERLLTLGDVAKGDLTAGGTAIRFNKRAPRVIAAYENSNLLFGAGYSNYFYENSDAHIGHQTLLLQSGIFGYVVLHSYVLFLMISGFISYLQKKNIFTLLQFLMSLLIISLSLANVGLTILYYSFSPEAGTVIMLVVLVTSYCKKRTSQLTSSYNVGNIYPYKHHLK